MKTLDLSYVDIVGLKTNRKFMAQWHYLGSAPTGKCYYFGWYITNLIAYDLDESPFTDILYASANYCITSNRNQAQYIARVTGYNVTNKNLIELKRLCRREPKIPELQLTAFISRCHKKLKRLGYRYIVSFSDPRQGHEGIIYKAANFIDLGETATIQHTVDKNGKAVHKRTVSQYAKRHGIGMKDARGRLGLSLADTHKKNGWMIKL